MNTRPRYLPLLRCILVLAATIAVAAPSAGGRAIDITYAGSALWSGIIDVAVQDTVAYCAAPYGLLLLNVADASNPRLLSQVFLDGFNAMRVEVDGNMAYLCAGNAGLALVDVSDPAAPVWVGVYDSPGQAWDVAVSGEVAYLADAGGGLVVVDVSNPTAPDSISRFLINGSAVGVAISGNFAYVATSYTDSLIVLDVSTPSSPARHGAFQTISEAVDVTVSGTYAYVPMGDSGVQIVDISNPAAPIQAARYLGGQDISRVEVVGDYAYVDGYNLTILDVTNPASPAFAGMYSNMARIMSPFIVGGKAYFASVYFEIVDVAVPASPTMLGRYDDVYETQHVAVAGDFVFVSMREAGLQVASIVDPDNPVPVGAYKPINGFAAEAVIADTIAYLANGWRGLEILDIGTPEAPLLWGGYDSVLFATGVDVSGSVACISNSDQGLLVLDVSDPAAPSRLGTYQGNWTAEDVVMSPNYAYVAAFDSGVQIIDITNPSAPTFAGAFIQPGEVRSVAIAGNLVYAAAGWAGLFIIDVSNPASPALIGSRPTSPGEATMSVSVSGSYAILSNDNAGVMILDVTDPSSPVVEGSFDTPMRAFAATPVGDHLYVADLYALLSLQLSTAVSVGPDGSVRPLGLDLLGNYPNPFNPSTLVRFTLPAVARVEIAVYNLLGQRVSVVFEGALPAGEHAKRWDGRNDSGNFMPSGTYFYRISADGEVKVGKMLLLK